MNKNESIDLKSQNSTRWSLLTEVAAKLIAPIVNMILARLLTPEAFGVIASVNMIVSFADVFTDAGFQKYLIQHDFKDKKDFYEHMDVAFWANLAISVAGWLIIFIFSDQLATLVGNPGLGRVVCVAALSLPFTTFSSTQIAQYRKKFDFKTLFYVRITAACVPLVVTVPIAFIIRSYWALIIGTLASNLTNAVLLTARSEWKPSLHFKFSQLKEMFSYSWWILIESIAVWMTAYLDTFIVGQFLSQTEVGLYKTGMSTVNQIVSLVSVSISNPMFSSLSALQDDDNEFCNMFYKYIRAVGTLMIPLSVGILIYNELVTGILLGSQWTSISKFVGFWGFANGITLIWGSYCNQVYNAKGKPKLSVLTSFLQLIVLIPTIIIGCQISFEALCFLRCIVRFELILVQAVLMKFVMHMHPSKYFIQSIPSLVCTVVMALAGVLLKSISNNMVWQLASVVLCIVVYFVLYMLLFGKQLKESFETLGLDIKLKRIKRS